MIGLARMNAVLEISPEDRLIRVQCGRTNLAVTGAVEGQGFFYAPDPSSQLACATMLDLFGRNPTLDGDVLRSMLETANESVLAQQLLGEVGGDKGQAAAFQAVDVLIE